MMRVDRLSRMPEMAMLGVSFLVVVLIGYLSYRNIQDMRRADEQREITQNILSSNAQLLSLLKDAETGQRGFLLTGNEEYLNPYHTALSTVPTLIERFKVETRSRSDQAQRLREIEPRLNAKLAELHSTIELRRQNKLAEAQAEIDSGRGKLLMDEIRVLCAGIDEVASGRLVQYSAAQDESTHRLRLVSTLGSLILLGFLVIATVVIFRGMKRREDLYKQAYASHKLLATTLTGIADAVIATDKSGHVTFINPVAQTLTGWNEADALGVHISKLLLIVNEANRMKVENPLERALAEGSVVGLANHTSLIAKNGQEVPIDDSAAPLRDESGKLVGAVLVFRDISARRIAERQLSDASAALEASNGELKQFVHAAAHDLRSPLQSVHAIAQLLALQFTDQLGPKGDELIGFITKGVGRMTQLLEDLLAFAQASHFDRSIAQLTPMDGAFQISLENLQAEAERTGAAITFDPLPVVAVHEAHMVQIFQNLIGNALKYHSGNAPRIHVSAQQSTTDWTIRVTDNGIGVAPEYREQIFLPFKRLHGEEYPGSGIGLATCKKIIAGYGGRIWAESTLGQGSIFFFTIPMSNAVPPKS